MIVLLFKSQLRADIDGDESWATKARMMDLVSKVPGFISDKTYTSEDGETVALVKFESEKAPEERRHHPEHGAVRRGREEVYQHSWIQVCRSMRAYEWTRVDPAATLRRADQGLQ